jgi:hypothetical protein
MSWKAKDGEHSEAKRESLNMDQRPNVCVTVEMDSQIFAANAQLRESADVNGSEFDGAFALLTE